MEVHSGRTAFLLGKGARSALPRWLGGYMLMCSSQVQQAAYWLLQYPVLLTLPLVSY